MAIKQQICLIKKYVTCVMAFTCVTRCVNFTLSSPLYYSLKITNYGMTIVKIFYIYGCFGASRFIKEGRKSNL